MRDTPQKFCIYEGTGGRPGTYHCTMTVVGNMVAATSTASACTMLRVSAVRPHVGQAKTVLNVVGESALNWSLLDWMIDLQPSVSSNKCTFSPLATLYCARLWPRQAGCPQLNRGRHLQGERLGVVSVQHKNGVCSRPKRPCGGGWGVEENLRVRYSRF